MSLARAARPIRHFLGLPLSLGGLFGCAAPVKEEPVTGMLKPGDVVRVDDGACSADKVRKITVGPPPSDRTQPSPRISTCAPR